MSDFLKQFSKDTYKNKVEHKKEETKEEANEDTSIFETQNTREEVYVRDEEKIKNRKKKIIIGSASFIVVILIGIFTYIKLNEVSVPNFVEEKTLNDVQIWSAKHKIELNYTSVYSVKVDQDYVVKQSIKAGNTIQKNSTFDIVVSKGADPNEHIKLPDFMKMDLTEIETWKENEKASNVSIEKVFSEEVEKSKTIRFEYITEGIDEKNYRRKDKIKIYVSKGKEEFEKNISVPDFKDKSKAEVELWAKENEIVVEYSEEANDKIIEGNVISQDIAPKTKIAKKDTIKIVISRGKVYYAPNFYGLDETQGQAEGSRAKVTTSVVYYYSNTVAADSLISQSIPAGSEVTDDIIVLTYSLGRPYISNHDGEDLYTMVQSISDMNKKGASLTYQVVEVSSSEKKGTIINTNYKSSFVNVGTNIVISVSRGN